VFFALWALCLRGVLKMPCSLGLKSKAQRSAVPTGLPVLNVRENKNSIKTISTTVANKKQHKVKKKQRPNPPLLQKKKPR
jgi:hypothetical protein